MGWPVIEPGKAAYAGFMILALVAFILARRLFPDPSMSRLPRLERFTLALAAFVGGTLIAKLPFAWQAEQFFDWSTWSADGKTVTTGLAGAYLSYEITKWIMGVREKTGDGFAIPLAFALAIGRWGCFCNGCCAGKVTTLPWGYDFGDGLARHPTQVYESLFHLICAIILVRLRQRNLFRYQRLKLYLIAYCLYRFLIEFVRAEPLWLGSFTYYQVVVVFFALFLAGQWVIDSRRRDGEAMTSIK